MSALIAHRLGFLDSQSLEADIGASIAVAEGGHLLQVTDAIGFDFIEAGIGIDEQPGDKIMFTDVAVGMSNECLGKCWQRVGGQFQSRCGIVSPVGGEV
jgi:hypothetical protein